MPGGSDVWPRLALAVLLVVYGVNVSRAATGRGFVTNQLREYFVAAVEVEWDYAPSGRNLIKDTAIEAGSYEATFLRSGTNRIGSKYKKAVFKQYTDDTYTQEIPKPQWLGFLGPLLYAEVGDTMFVHFKNMATRPYTMHPHGMKYEKDSEGAVYEDGTSGKDKDDENVQPGKTHRYKWIANPAAGPADKDENCVPWPYHSHISTPSGTNTGLIGALIICKDGILDENGMRTDVDKEFLIMFTITDENLSYYLSDNIATYATSPNTVDPDDDDFITSNKMDGVNGYLYGNLPDLNICLGDKVDWHLMAFGTEADIHTIYFHGNPLTFQGHRRDSLSLTPAVLLSANMVPRNPGTWLLTSASTSHFKDGAQALYTVSDTCGTPVSEAETVRQRDYFIAAEEVSWNYAPNKRTHSDGKNFTDPESHSYPFFTTDNNRIGGTYQKAVFVGYTSDFFTVLTPKDPHMGLLGPVIRGEVGDRIRVTLKNGLVGRNVSLQPHGVMYNKANEGQRYNDGTSGANRSDELVIPGSSYTYTWTIPDYFGPTDLDPDCITWIYTSAVDPEGDVFAGLVGPLLVCKQGSLNSTSGKQLRVDKEFFLLFTTFDENLSWLLNTNIADPNAVDKTNEAFVLSNQMASINGLSYNNVPGLNIDLGDVISWHLMAIGKFTDEHAVSFEGQTVTHDSRRKVTVPVFPGVSETVIMNADISGTFEIECETNSHLINGMEASLTVTAVENVTPPEVGSATRTYYIGIVERIWDFVPVKYDPLRSQDLNDPDSEGYIFVGRGPTFIGSQYKKALYREFTDDTFTMEKERGPADMHLGVQGPLLRMEVGDTVNIVLRNMASRPYGLQPHGVWVFEESADSADSKGVKPNTTKTYQWKVLERAGPTADDPNCVVYAYYSTIDKDPDTNAGLVGPMVVCRPGTLGENGRRRDVDREFALLFTVTDENKSWYLDENIAQFCSNPSAVDKLDPDFEESNLMHGINGQLYTNLRHLNIFMGETVEWYLIGIGDEVDMHSVHFHGQPVTYRSALVHRVDVFELFAGVYGSVQMQADNPGSWLLHCHVNDHILGGMETTYTVFGEDTTTVATTTPATACCITATAFIIALGIFMAWKFN